MATNYSPPANYISSSKDNVFQKHAVSVKSLKLEAPVRLTPHVEKVNHESVVAFV